MKSYIYRTGVIMMFIVTLARCKDPYMPSLRDGNLHYLVVEGTIVNSDHLPTTIKLSRTSQVSEAMQQMMEKNAKVTVQLEGGSAYTLAEKKPGVYVADNIQIPAGKKCYLQIITADGKKYTSNDLEVKTSPSIDSVGFYRKDQDFQIYVNTHDDNNATWYYLWEFEGTYEYRSQYTVFKKFVPVDSSLRDVLYEELESYYRCWKSDPSTQVLIGTSNNLMQDVIYNQPIHRIPFSDVRLDAGYSMLVRQYAISKEAYDYWFNLRKITEQLGDLFGTLPSEVKSNLRCESNPSEIVIGYVSASTVTEKRTFFIRPAGWRYVFNCEVADTVRDQSKASLANYFIRNRGYEVLLIINGAPKLGAVYNEECVNCVTRGGTNVRPDFWPQY